METFKREQRVGGRDPAEGWGRVQAEAGRKRGICFFNTESEDLGKCMGSVDIPGAFLILIALSVASDRKQLQLA